MKSKIAKLKKLFADSKRLHKAAYVARVKAEQASRKFLTLKHELVDAYGVFPKKLRKGRYTK